MEVDMLWRKETQQVKGCKKSQLISKIAFLTTPSPQKISTPSPKGTKPNPCLLLKMRALLSTPSFPLIIILFIITIMSNIFKAGRLFIWQAKNKPSLLKLPELVTKTSVGPQHIVAIGESGNLYSFGSGADGKLGHGDTKDVESPRIIDYFQKNNIKVKDAVAGERHTIVLSDKGEVYTFGYGRKDVNLFMKLFVNPVGPTGHGKDIPKVISKPTKVKTLEGHKIQRIAAGRNFCIVFNEKNEVYNWGNGEYAAFGDGNNKNYEVPTLNKHFEYLREEEKLEVKKIKSCESYSVALMHNGKLYGWGSNEEGQMGIKAEIGMEMYETVNFVTEVIREGYEEKKVVNFDISNTALLFQLDNGEFWWAGMRIAYKPEKLNFDPVAKPKLFAAGQKSLVIVDESNTLHSKNGFLQYGAKDDLDSIKTGFVKINGSTLFDGEIVGIGGEYSKRYAIVV